jgi:hypothetical protein
MDDERAEDIIAAITLYVRFFGAGIAPYNGFIVLLY